MIEDKDLGLKIAQDPIEAIWIQIEEKAIKDIRNAKIEIELSEHILKLAEAKKKHE